MPVMFPPRGRAPLVACVTVLWIAGCIPDARLLPTDSTGGGGTGTGGDTGTDGGEGGAGGAPGCEDKTVSADFTQSSIDEDGITIIPHNGFHYAAAYESWEYEYNTGSIFDGQFEAVAAALVGTLSVTHITPSHEPCPNGGYAPVTIRLNGNDVVVNYDPAENHGGSHAPVDDQWDIGPFVQQGANVISWFAEGACTRYRIQRLEIWWSSCIDG